jgi:hypothetical protein
LTQIRRHVRYCKACGYETGPLLASLLACKDLRRSGFHALSEPSGVCLSQVRRCSVLVGVRVTTCPNSGCPTTSRCSNMLARVTSRRGTVAPRRSAAQAPVLRPVFMLAPRRLVVAGSSAGDASLSCCLHPLAFCWKPLPYLGCFWAAQHRGISLIHKLCIPVLFVLQLQQQNLQQHQVRPSL